MSKITMCLLASPQTLHERFQQKCFSTLVYLSGALYHVLSVESCSFCNSYLDIASLCVCGPKEAVSVKLSDLPRGFCCTQTGRVSPQTVISLKEHT